MIALDSNVLVRLLVDDEGAQAQCERARRLVSDAVARSEPVFVSDIVLCEFVWVLRRVYSVDRKSLSKTLADLISAEHVQLERPAEVSRSVAAYAAGPADFSDYLLRELALQAGCDAVYSFDKKLLKSGSVREPK